MLCRRLWSPLMTRTLLPFAVAFATLACDTFLEVKGKIVSCQTRRPIADARVVAHLDRGVGEPDVDARSDREGVFRVWMNEPASAMGHYQRRIGGLHVGKATVSRDADYPRDRDMSSGIAVAIITALHNNGLHQTGARRSGPRFSSEGQSLRRAPAGEAECCAGQAGATNRT